MQSGTSRTNDLIRPSREYRREALLLSALGIPAAIAPFILYGIAAVIITIFSGAWGKEYGDILLLFVLLIPIWVGAVAIFVLVMLLRAGIAFYKARKQKLEVV
jgi:hypothetical protein